MTVKSPSLLRNQSRFQKSNVMSLHLREGPFQFKRKRRHQNLSLKSLRKPRRRLRPKTPGLKQKKVLLLSTKPSSSEKRQG